MRAEGDGWLTTAIRFSETSAGSLAGQFIAAVRLTAATANTAAAAIAERVRHGARDARVDGPTGSSLSVSTRIRGSSRTAACGTAVCAVSAVPAAWGKPVSASAGAVVPGAGTCL